MKKLPIILLGLMAFAGYSQNYKVVNPHLPAHYRTVGGFNNSAGFEVFSVDSVTMTGQDSLFYTYATIRDTADPGWGVCLDAEAGSIMGRTILQQNDRTVLFNFRDDSVVIRHLSSPGETWQMFAYGNGDHLEASHLNTQLMEVLSFSDSVKVINLLRKDSGGNLIEDDINGMNILLSKHYGLIQTIDFYIFPAGIRDYVIAGMQNPVAGITNLDAEGVYDFNIDDEFHFVFEDIYEAYDPEDSTYKIIAGNTGRMIRYVIDRVDYGDSVTYTYTDCAAVIHYQNDITDTLYTTETVTKTYRFDSIRPGLLNAYPGQKIKSDEWEELYYDISYFTTEVYNYHPQKNIVDYAFMKDDSCLIYSIFDPCCYTETYVQGCGGPYFTWSDWFGNNDKNLLVYFNKSGDTWGAPLARDCEDLLSAMVEKPVSNIKVQVSPNPFTGRLFVAIPARIHQIEIIRLYGIGGRLIKAIEVNDYAINADLSGLPEGIYLLEIRLDNGQMIRKKVVKKGR